MSGDLLLASVDVSVTGAKPEVATANAFDASLLLMLNKILELIFYLRLEKRDDVTTTPHDTLTMGLRSFLTLSLGENTSLIFLPSF